MKKTFYMLFAALFFLPLTADAAARISTISVPANQLGVTAYWSFDSSTVSGNTVSDLSGNGHNLTLVNGASVAAGHNGQALTLDGTNQYAWGLIGSLPTSVSLSMWVKANDVATEQSVLTEEGDGAPSSGYHYTLVGIYNGAFYAGFWNIGDIASSPINAGQWYNVVLYYDGIAQTQSLYVDGVLQGTQSGAWAPPDDIYFLAGYPQQGCSFTSASGHCSDLANYFNGQIDDLKGYNRALTQSDISSLQSQRATLGHSSAAPLSKGLVDYWPMDGNTTNWAGPTTQDIVGSITGTLTSVSGAITAVAGKIGQALSLASGAYIPTSGSNVSAPCTVTGWVNLRNSASQSHGYPMMDSGQYSLRVQQVGNTIAGETAYGVSDDTFSPSYTVPQNAWTYLVFVNNTGTATLYANGAAVGTISKTYGCPVAFVGGNSGDWFSGYLDDIRVYNRALSASEVSQLYRLGQTNIAHSPGPTTNAGNINSGLVGYWTMDGSTINWRSNTIADMSGTGNTGTLVSLGTTTAPVAGKVGQALKFDGSASYISIPRSVTLEPTTISFGAWFRATSTTTNTRILSKTESGGYSLAFNDTVTGLDATVNIGGTYYYVTDTNIAQNTWYYAMATYDGETLRLYVNGVDVSDNTSPSGAIRYTSAIRDCIGSEAGSSGCGAGNYFPGSIDDVRIYNRALSASEVAQLYQMGR
ncbi:MAG TPA: LamG-like jellyroll fold domain-containing protein [Candidatus Paceibacterota bacterium]|nr:LamG-like jellyroll fold domain-containing protein [Candidatus Paceibacterota bacterium]